MKLKRFYQYVESKKYDVESILKHPTHNETFFNMLIGVDYISTDRMLFANILNKNLNSDLVSKELRSEILEYFKVEKFDAQTFLNEGFFDKLKQSWDTVKDKTSEISDKAKEVLGNIIEKAKNAVDFVKKVKNFIADAFKRLIEVGVEKIKDKLKLDKQFTDKVKEASKNKEGIKKDVTVSAEVIKFYKTNFLNKIGDIIDKNVPTAVEDIKTEDSIDSKDVEIIVGQKYMYLNSQGKDIEVSVVDDADKTLVQVNSANSEKPFKVKRDKLRLKDDGFINPEDSEKLAANIASREHTSIFYDKSLTLNENIIGDLIHKIEKIPPFSYLEKVKEFGEGSANLIISFLSEITAKLGGPKFVLPVIASLIGVALEYNIKGLAKHNLIDVAAYFTVPFLIPLIKFIGYVATFIAVIIIINDITNMGILDHSHDNTEKSTVTN